MSDRAGPARDLQAALAAMSFRLEPGVFRLLAFPGTPPGELARALEPPAQLVVEEGEATVLLRDERARELAGRHPRALDAGRFRWITFEAPMGWEVVGFLAHVTSRLAAAGVPIGCVCSFRRDHLFVAEPHLERALTCLRGLFPESPRRSDEPPRAL